MAENTSNNNNDIEARIEGLSFNPGLKKKKKAASSNRTNYVLPQSAEPISDNADRQTTNYNAEDGGVDLTPKTTETVQKFPIVAVATAIGVDGSYQVAKPLQPEADASTGADFYTYDELLKRAFAALQRLNDVGNNYCANTIFAPKAPSVVRIGSKRTGIANFAAVCESLKRQTKHLQSFITAELGTSGSLDRNECLIIKGKFQQVHIESVLRKYIKEYVTCHTCRAHRTILQKSDRLLFLLCESCHSRCSVSSIKTGYQAQVS